MKKAIRYMVIAGGLGMLPGFYSMGQEIEKQQSITSDKSVTQSSNFESNSESYELTDSEKIEKLMKIADICLGEIQHIIDKLPERKLLILLTALEDLTKDEELLSPTELIQEWKKKNPSWRYSRIDYAHHRYEEKHDYFYWIEPEDYDRFPQLTKGETIKNMILHHKISLSDALLRIKAQEILDKEDTEESTDESESGISSFSGEELASVNTKNHKYMELGVNSIFSLITNTPLSLDEMKKIGAFLCKSKLSGINLSFSYSLDSLKTCDDIHGLKIDNFAPHWQNISSLLALSFGNDYFKNLKSLTIDAAGLVDSDIETIIRSEGIRTVTSLCLKQNKFTIRGISALASSENLTSLTSLNLGTNGLGDNSVKTLSDSIYLTNLERLNLMQNYIDSQGAIYISQSSNFQKLKRLILYSNSIESKGTKAILTSPNLSSITKLDLGNNYILKDAFFEISMTYMANLRVLKLSYNPHIRDEGMSAMINILKLSNLVYLDLTRTCITDKMAEAIATNIKTLTTFIVRTNEISHSTQQNIKENLLPDCKLIA